MAAGVGRSGEQDQGDGMLPGPQTCIPACLPSRSRKGWQRQPDSYRMRFACACVEPPRASSARTRLWLVVARGGYLGVHVMHAAHDLQRRVSFRVLCFPHLAPSAWPHPTSVLVSPPALPVLRPAQPEAIHLRPLLHTVSSPSLHKLPATVCALALAAPAWKVCLFLVLPARRPPRR